MKTTLSDFIQEQETGFAPTGMTLEQSYMEMAIATNISEAYAANNAVLEYCAANNIQIYDESFKDKLGELGGKAKDLGKKVVTFIKALVRNIINAIAADKIDKTIGIIKEKARIDRDNGIDTVWIVEIPDIEKLLNDIEEFTKYVSEGFASGNAAAMQDNMTEILKAANSAEALAKRYEPEKKEMSTQEYVDILRKAKDGRNVAKAKKILADLDKTNFRANDENGNLKVSGDVIKSIKQMTNLFVKVYDKFFKEITKKEYDDAVKKFKSDFSKEERDDAQDYTADERKRKVNESFYFV